MTNIELSKILYALQKAYGKKEAIKLFEKIIKTIAS